MNNKKTYVSDWCNKTIHIEQYRLLNQSINEIMIWYKLMSTKVVHRFLREPNHAGDITNRIANRFNPFKNTLAVLKDPEHDRTLFLVGTTNSSTTIA